MLIYKIRAVDTKFFQISYYIDDSEGIDQMSLLFFAIGIF